MFIKASRPINTVAASLLFGALTASMAISTPPALADDLTDPYQIFARARHFWEQQRYPEMVGYTIHVTALQKGKQQERHYAARWSGQTNGVALQVVSTEEQEHPFKPAGGFGFGIPFVASINIGGVGTGTNGDLLGLPFIAPVYFFDMAKYVPAAAVTPAELVKQIREQFHDPDASKVAQLSARSEPPIIATVSSTSRDYTIWLLGIDQYEHHRDYHLVLSPVGDSKAHRLRELWINTETFGTDKLISLGNFTSSPSVDVPWTVTFNDVGGARYIGVEVADAKLVGGKQMRLIKNPSGNYDTWMVSIENVAPASGQFFGGTAKDLLTEP